MKTTPIGRPQPDQVEQPVETDAETTQQTAGPRQVIEQAASDIARGLKDTDLHGVPSDVPGPAPAPEDSPGAEVPAQGVGTRTYGEHQLHPGKPGK